MHLLFLDESGTPPGPNKAKNKYFVIGGIVIPEGHWSRIRDALAGLKLREKLRGEIKWRYFAPGNDDPKNPMLKRSPADRDKIREEIYTKIICSDRSIKAIACVCCIEAAYQMPSITDRDALYQGTYKPVSERFQYHLQDLSRSVGREEYGIIVADHRGLQDDTRFRLSHERMVNSSAEFTSTYKNIVESLFLQPSHYSVGIQLADMVAGAVWRKYEANDDKWYLKLQPAIRTSKTGLVDGYGIVKYPKGTWQ